MTFSMSFPLLRLWRFRVCQRARSKGTRRLVSVEDTQQKTFSSSAARITSILHPKQDCLGSSAGFAHLGTLGNGRGFCVWSSARGFFGKGGGSSTPQQSLQGIARGIKEGEYKKVVVMVGAGISTPSGIPDFRSPGSGLYDNLQQYKLPYAEAIFEINYFHYNPQPFFALAKELYPGNYQPNLTHYFIRLLYDKGQLLRLYTQNIDGLERRAGIPPSKLVEAHGTFATATCTVCRKEYPGEDLRADIMASAIPKCSTCKGIIKPDIVFFGEELPQQFLMYLTDFPMADLLIIMGTSLEVEPFASLAGAVRGSVPRLLFNRDAVGPFAHSSLRHNDVAELGDVVSGVQKLVDAMGWTKELQALMATEAQKVLSSFPRRSPHIRTAG
ncbi:NAD-dependent protein deacetylase sirtuin-3, mitochondrial isoform X1 [Scleropages formosus]|uniref:NAD-dependent protein deacetylase sirtuin-3, mitochondrial isoform X1 n=2 Tax=Scleropages formosus TaxID=113540 RepID=UPI000878D0B1|nr:NAD-dependent protein deacetylase sirtuin-3, mitochondrial isoform X1 [Scleropages formosus]